MGETNETGWTELVHRPMPGVTLTVSGPVDDEVLAIGVAVHLLDRVVGPQRALDYIASRVVPS